MAPTTLGGMNSRLGVPSILINTQSFDSDFICISYLNPLYKVTPALPQK